MILCGTIKAGKSRFALASNVSTDNVPEDFGIATTTIAWPNVGCATPKAATSLTSPVA